MKAASPSDRAVCLGCFPCPVTGAHVCLLSVYSWLSARTRYDVTSTPSLSIRAVTHIKNAICFWFLVCVFDLFLQSVTSLPHGNTDYFSLQGKITHCWRCSHRLYACKYDLFWIEEVCSGITGITGNVRCVRSPDYSNIKMSATTQQHARLLSDRWQKYLTVSVEVGTCRRF